LSKGLNYTIISAKDCAEMLNLFNDLRVVVKNWCALYYSKRVKRRKGFKGRTVKIEKFKFLKVKKIKKCYKSNEG
jgi:hypothetical protein